MKRIEQACIPRMLRPRGGDEPRGAGVGGSDPATVYRMALRYGIDA